MKRFHKDLRNTYRLQCVSELSSAVAAFCGSHLISFPADSFLIFLLWRKLWNQKHGYFTFWTLQTYSQMYGALADQSLKTKSVDYIYLFSGSLVGLCSSDPHFGVRVRVVRSCSAVGGRHRWNHGLNHPLQVRARRDRSDSWHERGTWDTQVCEILKCK